MEATMEQDYTRWQDAWAARFPSPRDMMKAILG